MMTDQELFEAVKRDGECWHEWSWFFFGGGGQAICEKCGEMGDGTHINLYTEQGFFYLWERAQEKDWWIDFLGYLMQDNWPIPFEPYFNNFIEYKHIDRLTFPNRVGAFLEGR